MNNRIAFFRERINNRRVVIANAQSLIRNIDREQAESGAQRATQQSIINNAETDNALDIAELQRMDVDALRIKNMTLYLAKEPLLVIPFLLDQGNEMPTRIVSATVLNCMQRSHLEYYLRGYDLSTVGNLMVRRRRLAIFIGIPKIDARSMYSEPEAFENMYNEPEDIGNEAH
jgi:hypothetical protein